MDIQEVEKFWNKVKENLKSNGIPSLTYKMWIEPLKVVNFENNTLELITPQQLSINILSEYNSIIKSTIQEIISPEAMFSVHYDADYGKEYILTQKKAQTKIIPGQSEDERKELQEKQHSRIMQSEANLNLNLKFDNFVVGDNSKFAYNAAFAVANCPSKKFNPLFIYGASGLGKTHLLQAIGHHILFNTKLKVKYIRMEEYCNEWLKCFSYSDLPNGMRKTRCNDAQMRKFHQKFQNIDILLMDDIQFIESRIKTMEDFFSIFEALYTNNKQIVIASDRLPSDIPKLDSRLRSRFEMGLVVDIVPPEYETRFEIVKAYALERGLEADDDVYKFIAQNFKDNVRELKGALTKVGAYSEIFNVGLTLENAQKALKLEIKKKELTPALIAKSVSKYYDLKPEELKGSSRKQKISQARQLAIYLSRELIQMSYESIGDFFDKKHTTVLYSCEQVEEKLKNDTKLRQSVDEIKEMLKDV